MVVREYADGVIAVECKHEFAPEYDVDTPDYDDKGDDEGGDEPWRVDDRIPGVEDGVWSCPHEAVAGQQKCIFHLPIEERPEDMDATAAFLQCVEAAQGIDDRDEQRRQLQFIDAEFPDFNIKEEVIGGETNCYITLAHAELHDADLTGTRFQQPVRFKFSQFVGDAWAKHTQFEERTKLNRVTFKHDVRFRGAEFHAPVHLNNTVFEQGAWFWHAVFHRFVIFRNCTFVGKAYFRGIDFLNYVRFSQSQFEQETTFELGEFGDDADFIDVSFDDVHSFVGAEFERTTDFTGATVNGPMNLSETSIENFQMAPEQLNDDTQYVDLSKSFIKSGELCQPEQGEILYDVTAATLGSVEFIHPNDGAVIDHIRFVRTRYEGFEFETDDMDPQASQWRLHTVFDETVLPAERRGPLESDTLRETYLQAKNGAQQAGNSTAVGQFYYKEMTYRRKHLLSLFMNNDSSRLSLLSGWFRNLSLMLVTGYGEYPLRIVSSSVAAILGFAAIFRALLTPTPSLTESILFSSQSFITFIVGPTPRETTQIVTMLSIIEGFLGGFFVALFVYAFTRRLNR